MINTKAEYIWIDGNKPTAKLRSKTRIIYEEVNGIDDLPEWGFDGSSTLQAEGHFSDCLLKPVSYLLDPLRGGNDILVMCEEAESYPLAQKLAETTREQGVATQIDVNSRSLEENLAYAGARRMSAVVVVGADGSVERHSIKGDQS